MADSRELIKLASGEHALFGYGTLLSKESLERTLGRSYTGPFAVTGSLRMAQDMGCGDA